MVFTEKGPKDVILKYIPDYEIISIGRDEAIKIDKAREWESWSDDEKVNRQLHTEELMMPFGVFHQAVAHVLQDPGISTIAFTDPISLLRRYYAIKNRGALPA